MGQPRGGGSPLADRELEVLPHVAEELSNEEIGARLHLSPLTAETHLSRILTKPDCRVQLVLLADETGLVQPGRR